MSTKKTTTANKTVKQYLVIDGDGDPLAYGTMNEIVDALNEYNDGDEEYDEISFDEWISQCIIYELGAGKKMKYTPAKYEIK
jgi:uncharacterized Fe-S cluster-containing radical SAM superfamily enzyme